MSGAFDSISTRRTLSDVVFHKLRDAVIDGRLEAGQWLRQETLAQELGVSQMPVREALKRLVAEGLAERIPYRGVKVIEFSPEDVADMFTIRMMLEGLAVRLAAPVITDQDLQNLRQNVDRASGLTAQDQMAERRRLNTEFHLTLCRASERRFLIRQLETLWNWFPSVMLYEGMRRQETLSSTRLARESQEHREILSALQAQDAQRAETAIHRHIYNLSEELAQVLGLPPEAMEPLKGVFHFS